MNSQFPAVPTTADSITGTDRSLIRLVRDGDQQAACDLYERYARRTLGLVHQQMADHLRARQEPEDIVQSVFKSIFRGIQAGSYEAPDAGSLWSLLSVITVHKVCKCATRQSAARRDDRRTVPLTSVDGDQLTAGSSPEVFEQAIAEILEVLREPERRVVQLRLAGHSVEEISDQLQLSRRSTERLLQRAREKLSDLLLDDTEVQGPTTT